MSRVRLISLATQKFLSDICSNSMQFCKKKQEKPGAAGSGSSVAAANAAAQKRLVLTTEELKTALKEYGIVLKKPDYFSDDVNLKSEGAKLTSVPTSSMSK